MMASWNIEPSICSVNTINPIRNIVDRIKRPENHPLPIIDLALGDPAVFGNLPPAPEVINAVQEAVKNPKTHGYTNSMGVPAAREAVAKFMTERDSVSYTANDIVIASGASQAILLAIQLLCNPGDALLLPCPGFSLYQTICGHLGVRVLAYRLDSAKSWESDIAHMEELVATAARDGYRVKGMLFNNPGNPTGSNYSRAHLEELQAFCARHKLPVIADEIYGHMVFKGQTFTPFASLAGDVPVFTVGGLAKQFLVPGWRVGWLAIHDAAQHLAAARPHLVSLTQVVLGSTTVVQHALPHLFNSIPESYYSTLTETLESQAQSVVAACSGVPGLKCITPQGAMYVMVKLDMAAFRDIASDSEFAQKLLSEQNVMVLPGACFNAPGFFRIVYCAPAPKLEEFAQRLAAFCKEHAA